MFKEAKGRLKLKLTRTTSLIVMCTVFAGSTLTVNALSRDYSIIDGKEVRIVHTIDTNANKIMQKSGVNVTDEDEVFVNEDLKTITVRRMFDVEVVDKSGEVKTLRFNQGTVKDALDKLNISLDKNDTVAPSLETPLDSDMGQIVVTHWNDVSLEVDGVRKDIQVPQNTKVESTLKSVNVSVTDHDIISVDKKGLISDDTSIVIQRVGFSEETTTEPIHFNTIRKETEALKEGETQVETAGVDGERTVTRKNRIVDGVLESSEELSSTVLTAAVDEVLLVGTRKTLNLHGTSLSYKKIISGSCTAYTSNGGRTATGAMAQVGYVAVDPNIIPYGTKLYICSPDGSYIYGYAIASDTGGAARSGQIIADLYFNSEAECAAFGRRQMSIYILD